MYANKILLAEDDTTDAEFFQRALSRLESPPELIWCKSGTEAYQGLTQHSDPATLPRLAILDIKMPGMNGLELLEKIKSDERTKNMPVIIMSSSDEPQDISRAYDCGANGYLVKPNRFQDLRDLVGSIHHFWIKTNRLKPVHD
ncbi:CheY-like chemotaxis protein [Lewinella aquimaris]|uniref:CheY-like chemotaxis protein n=1 Tax=Neolewinella aquimaris TaxID=1835722 RepID=A0A840E8Z7_9BACT|nr:response regulator [Neolewinella aquimaris]MBB4080192.1 CheY-like chemotaxis protein [Neolewinella aquimaris]